MTAELSVAAGGYSAAGRKPSNQDAYGVRIPELPQSRYKGVAAAIADGISSSNVSHIASETAVSTFLSDYYCTSDAWSVRHAAERVLTATNYWLHNLTRQSESRYDRDRGYVCTFSAIVIKASTAHIFHAGDSRIYRLRNGKTEPLTEDHRLQVSSETSYLTRALGFRAELEVDYAATAIEPGDRFLLLTDGVYAHLSMDRLASICAASDVDQAARELVDSAFESGSDDNLTAVVLRIDAVPPPHAARPLPLLAELPAPPALEVGQEIDGYQVHGILHSSSRSRVYRVSDAGGKTLVMKTPAIDTLGDPAQLDRFLTEEWIGRRIDNANVIQIVVPDRPKNFLYTLTEYVDGKTLRQWMHDHPNPSWEEARRLIEQIARGLQAFHRMEMLHQDLRPDNVMLSRDGTVKIIDFGAVRVAGIEEMGSPLPQNEALGTLQYMAPEYLLGERGSQSSDIYSLGVIAYQLLTGHLPYGAALARARTRSAQRQIQYASSLGDDREIPVWVDGALRKAVEVDPVKRYAELSEFLYDLHHPREEFLTGRERPLIERDPAAFYKRLCFVLAVLLAISLLAHLA